MALLLCIKLPMSVLHMAKEDLDDFDFSCHFVSGIVPADVWQNPHLNFIKVNYDAVIFYSSLKIGIEVELAKVAGFKKAIFESDALIVSNSGDKNCLVGI
ncbi:hypothetical protein ACFE04_031972 [Oxalis oulophora]